MGSNPIEDTNNNHPRFAYAMIASTISCREIPNSFYKKVKLLNNNIMTVQKKFFWKLNAIISAIVFVILAIVFCYRYYSVGYPVEANWTEEILKYVVMWPAISIVCWGTFYVPVRAFSSYLAKKHGEEER